MRAFIGAKCTQKIFKTPLISTNSKYIYIYIRLPHIDKTAPTLKMAEAIMDLFGHFQQRVGAFADVHELEYIMMLLQTGSKLRSNATVSGK